MAFVSSFLLFSSHNNHTSNLESFGPSLFLLQFNSVALTVYAAGLFMLLKVSRTKFERDVVTNADRIAEKSTVKTSKINSSTARSVHLPFKLAMTFALISGLRKIDIINAFCAALWEHAVGNAFSQLTTLTHVNLATGGPVFPLSEVKVHCTVSDLWLIIDSEVYDATSFAPDHPGGTIINKYAGKDCSDQFKAFHRPRVAGYLKKYRIGSLRPEDRAEPSAATVAYRDLRTKLWKDGHFKPNATYYYGRHAVWVFLILLSVVCVMRGPNFSVRVLLGGCSLGLGLQQAAFLAHDAAHNGVLEPAGKGSVNWLAWFLGSVVFGISISMWTEEHSMHHAITIRPREDPQFNYLPIWLIDKKELENEEVDGKGGYKMNPVVKFLVRLQHFHFLPLVIIVGRVNLHAISVVFELKRIFEQSKSPSSISASSFLGLLGMAVYWTWHGTLVSHLPTYLDIAIFSLCSHITAGFLHIQLLLSHMNVATHTEEEEDAMGFFKFQCQTSRNIKVEPYEDWFHGGLQYQIEHHLFPQLPRHQLIVVKPMVEEICSQHGVIYRDDTFTEALTGVLRNLKELAWAVVTLDQ
ncbi:hypothetical protein TrST_g9657 [Triparma strigata]|uniref:Cytochrome b5 heme-binding domain-containing protein n=1 Tax=Triparma strigata TaxID=1606541 RepID=A0A9W7A973_9STRA|nr:hypothetical protein TrST_g9657 [Triparma strigata]